MIEDSNGGISGIVFNAEYRSSLILRDFKKNSHGTADQMLVVRPYWPSKAFVLNDMKEHYRSPYCFAGVCLEFPHLLL